MTNYALLAEFYSSALPPVRERPLPTMPKSLYAYVGKVSASQQLRLCLLTIMAFPLTLVPLELQRRIVNGAIEGQNVGLLLRLGALYLAVVVAQGILKFVRNFYLDRVAEGVTRLLRKRIAHSDGFNSDPDEGTRQAIISAEAEKVGGFVAEAIAFPLRQAGVMLSVAGYMLVVEPLIAMVAIAFLVPAMIVVALSQPILNRLSEKKIMTVRELGECVLRDEAGGEAEPLIGRIYRLRLRFAAIKHATKGLNNLMNHMGPLSVLMVGGWLVIQGQTEIGTIVAFMSGYERMTGPARELLNFYRRLSMMRVQYRLIHNVS